MKELEQRYLFITGRQLCELFKPYVRSIRLAVAYSGEVAYSENSGRWSYNKDHRISDEKIGYFGSILTKSGHYLNIFWSVEEAKEYAQKHSRMYNKQQGVWYEHFDKVALKKIERFLLQNAYSYEKRRENQQ